MQFSAWAYGSITRGGGLCQKLLAACKPIHFCDYTHSDSVIVSLALALNVNMSWFEQKNHYLWPTLSAFSRNDESIVISIYTHAWI